MSHLGLTMAAVAAKKGCSVVCYDLSRKKIALCLSGVIEIAEPLVEDVLFDESLDVSFTQTLDNLFPDLILVAQDVPTDQKGNSDLSNVESLIHTLFKTLDDQIPLVIMSQVPVGFTRPFQLARKNTFYQVETLIFGLAFQRGMNPERLVIGKSEDVEIIPSSYQEYINLFDCPSFVIDFESAEFSKLAINLYLASDLTMTGFLAEICEKTNISWTSVQQVLKTDHRLGSYNTPGLGIGGTNINRDIKTVASLTRKNGINGDLLDNIVKISNARKQWPINIISLLSDIDIVAIWGLAYKEETNSIVNSSAIKMLRAFPNIQFNCYDRLIGEIEHFSNATLMTDPIECLNNCDVLYINNKDIFNYQIDMTQFSNVFRGKIVIDPYCCLDTQLLARSDIKHIVMGKKIG